MSLQRKRNPNYVIVYVLICLVTLFICCCSSDLKKINQRAESNVTMGMDSGITPDIELPLGATRFIAYESGNVIGETKSMSSLENGRYTYVSSLKLKTPFYTTEEETTIIENAQTFRPVYFKKKSNMTMQGKTRKTTIKANIEGDKAIVDTNGSQSTIEIDDDVHFPNGYVSSWLLKQRFKKGAVLRTKIFSPSVLGGIELFDLVVEVLGEEDVKVNEQTMRLFKVKQNWADSTELILHYNAKGVAYRFNINVMGWEALYVRQ